ncbi:uncharacterized protein RHOBADRAFT_53350 [Rhodotorula graminis WP1]|uniref:F-box domain-containing protein n=1 Tax=Rhodotorula graminis (strain WP1) TaxID=578459 RepID=A0A194S4B7_RHOGW|nr:uncharacterized protein RHOBADRAFT_53350 [Rhodotorula graminis WP1]KPV75365.1 hypothetical protein RHOBADRAFT_53350 [Rhodotorula graminis WP1]
MAFSAFRSPLVDLGDFLRSLAVPRTAYGTSAPSREQEEWEVFRARQGGTKRLDYFGGDVVGPAGAVLVLRSMEKSPGVTDIVLSQNQLGDDGMRELLVGMKRLRSRDIGAHLESLNLSNCALSDVSLHLIALHLLQPSPHPPSLRSLYLNYNGISLGSRSTLSTLPEFLGGVLSSPSCSLRCLDLTSNRGVTTPGFTALLSSLKLAAGPSHLAELRLSVTGLTPDCAEPLAEWLEDPSGGGRLLVLTLNACALGPAGVRRLNRSVTSGRAPSLLHLEALANGDAGDEQWGAVNAALAAGEEEELGDEAAEKARVQEALKRNQRVYRETRFAALRLAAPARILFGGNARELEEGKSDDGSFPFLRLPIELQVHVLRCLVLLSPSRAAHLYPTLSRPLSTSFHSSDTLSSPLTEPQFLRLLAHCASRPTLLTERRIAAAHAAGEAPSLNAASGSKTWTKPSDDAQDPQGGWEEWFLRSTGCDRFERAAPL